jgi:DNA mismatch repair ATPase MutS
MFKLRAKDVTQAIKQVDQLLDTTNIPQTVIDDIVGLPTYTRTNQISLGSSVLDDLSLKSDGSTFKALDKTLTRGGTAMLSKILASPTQSPVDLEPMLAPETVKELAALEPDVLWALSIDPEALKKPPLSALYPNTAIVSYMNHSPHILATYHIYRAYGAPLMSVMSPLSAVLAPYGFVRYKLGFQIGLVFYFSLLWRIFLETMLNVGTGFQAVFKYCLVAFYIFAFLYHIVNTFEVASLVRRMRNEISQKVKSIGRFLEATVSSAKLQVRTLSDMYRLLRSPAKRLELKRAAHKLYEADVRAMCKGLLGAGDWCVPVMHGESSDGVTPVTRFWGLKHPGIGPKQRSNPASLEQNLIVTGPNAAGKSTYVKSILMNILFAHTLGIVHTHKADVCRYDAIHSYMRIWDSPGEESLFEAEVSRCKTIIEIASQVSAMGRGVFFLDEPMHSTPPQEGAATAKALIQHLGEMPGVRIVVCTHFHSIPQLEDDLPALFRNVSMSAVRKPMGGFRFPFKLKRGPSFQCIALDLIEDKLLPPELIANAKRFVGAF